MENNKGVSLIILVITVIMMIILTSIIIFTLTDSNIIKRSKEAVDSYNIANQNEQTMIDNIDKLLNSNSGNIIDIPKIEDIPGELETIDEQNYFINCIEDLVAFSNNVNNEGESYQGKTVVLARDLDFNDESSYVDATDRTLFGDYNADGTIENILEELTKGTGFTPIGNSCTFDNTNNTIEGNYFKGTFEGNNNIIKNIYINKSVDSSNLANVGLFAVISGNVTNLSISGEILLSSTDSSGTVYAGNIAGVAVKTKITNCNSGSKVSIVKCSTANAYIGGICGKAYDQTLINNSNNYAEIQIGQCYGSVYIGGVCGILAENSVIKESNNHADIVNTKQSNSYDIKYMLVGGVVGHNLEKTKVYKCYNTGKIEAEGSHRLVIRIGGISGTNVGIIQGVYNKGNVKATGDNCYYCIAGGICASNSSNISETYSTGTVSSSNIINSFHGGILR